MPGLLAAAIPAIAGGVMGMVSQGWGRQQQLQQSANLIKQQTKAAKELGQYSHDLQYDMWQKTNYKPQVEQMQKAGLNPALMYGMSGGGGVTTGSGSVPLPSIPSAEGPSGTAQVIAKGMDMAMMMSQKRLMDAQASKAEAEAAKTSGVDTANVQADTENKILAKVINDYTGKELQRVYERIKKPMTSIESETWMKELEARQGPAHVLYELWRDGKLHDKANAEIEQLMLQNSKSREETKNIIKTWDILEENLKGAKLDNIMKELESKLQTETGIDKTSPAWMKILGRLFIGLTGK